MVANVGLGRERERRVLGGLGFLLGQRERRENE